MHTRTRLLLLGTKKNFQGTILEEEWCLVDRDMQDALQASAIIIQSSTMFKEACAIGDEPFGDPPFGLVMILVLNKCNEFLKMPTTSSLIASKDT